MASFKHIRYGAAALMASASLAASFSGAVPSVEAQQCGGVTTAQASGAGFATFTTSPSSSFSPQFGGGSLLTGQQPGPAFIVGSSGNDTISGSSFNDIICGKFGNDSIAGQGANDTIRGGLGNDALYGDNFPGANLNGGTVNGGFGFVFNAGIGATGNDSLKGGQGADTMDGGQGTDTCNSITALGSDASQDAVVTSGGGTGGCETVIF